MSVELKSGNLTAILNKQIANWGVLFVKLHNFHWYVKGSQFFTLHTKFEELYNEAAANIDELAERVLAIKGRPLATMSEYLVVASVKEATGKESATEQVAALVEDFEAIIEQLKEGIEAAQEAGDESTGDLLLGIHTALEKHVWMLASFLG